MLGRAGLSETAGFQCSERFLPRFGKSRYTPHIKTGVIMNKAVFRRYRWIIGLIILIGVVVFIWSAPLLLIFDSRLDGVAQRGQFGDMFGVVNALFTGLAFAFVAITLFEQQRQSARRDFEAVFFELLKMHSENVRQTFATDSAGQKIEGILAFSVLWKDLSEIDGMAGVVGRMGVCGNPVTSGYLGDCYVRFYESANREQVLGNYFRTLYHLMKYILDQDALSKEQKYKYAKIVRARMSRDELALLFFNGLSEYGEDSVEYIEAFSMFKHLDQDQLNIKNPEQYYSPRAFDPIRKDAQATS